MKVLDLLKKYGVLLLVLVGGIAAGVWFYLKNKTRKIDFTQVKREADKQLDRIGQNNENHKDLLKLQAQKLAHHLGTAYMDWYDPRRWSENDHEAFKILNDMSKLDFDAIEKIYPLYAHGRNLKNDLVKLLDKKYYDKIEERII